MDPNPNSYPVLSYVMSRLSKLPSFKTAQSACVIDIDPETKHVGGPNRNRDEYVELMERMPRLQHPALLASMTAAISNVAQTRSVLGSLGARPDHETVDCARARLAEIDEDLFRQLDEIGGAACPDGADPIEWREDQEKECRARMEREKVSQRAIIQLDDMHESYEKLLRDAEEKLVNMYEAGGEEYSQEAPSMGEVEVEEEERANEEVIAILQQGSSKCLERVDLSDRQLRHLPEAFGRLRGLISLNLSNNQLSAVPDAISGLECLEELRLSSNSLTSLPDSLGLLLGLKILYVSANKLKSLPDSISKCRSLVELDASYNELAYLPTNIGYELQKLEKLCVHLNKIRSLPTSVCEMRSLRLVDAHFNELRGLPDDFGKLTSLAVLDLSSNFSDLQELPATFGDLLSLRELNLSNNQIRELPDTFGRLDKLIKLNLDQNPLVVPPLEVVSQGVQAVKEYMAKRWIDMLLEEERKHMAEETTPPEAGWLQRGTSWVSSMVSGVSQGVTGYLGGTGQKSFNGRGQKSFRDPYLDQQL